MKAWARCPECSPGGKRGTRDKVVRIRPEQTHGAIERACPDCGEDVRLSIGGPVIREALR